MKLSDILAAMQTQVGSYVVALPVPGGSMMRVDKLCDVIGKLPETLGREFIVAEITKTWMDGLPTSNTPIISQQFQNVIEVNMKRGYALHTWELKSVAPTPNTLTEIIVAIFEHVE